MALASCALVLAVSIPAFGQATSGTVTGFVFDPAAAVVPEAKITLIEVNRGVSFTASTNYQGWYTTPRIPSGVYSLKVEKAGFKTLVRGNVLLSVDSVLKVDATLEVGALTEQVQVTAEAPILKSERADVSTTVDKRMVSELPTLGRNIASLQALAPGAVKHISQVGLAENPQGSIRVNSNGLQDGMTNMLLDGVDDNENVVGGKVVLPNLESVQELKMTTSSWDAEYGRVGGTLTQIETKSGQNELHGSLFEFLRNDKTNARNAFTQPTGPPPFKWNQFGGSVSGPIKRNKVFFFADYQGTQQRLGNTAFGTVPTMPMRTGDFSQIRDAKGNQIPIFDPLTGDQNGVGRQAFAGNRIPDARISPVARNLLALLPAPSYPDRIEQNFIAVGSTKLTTHQPSGRIDYYLNDKTRLFGRYIFFKSDLFSPPIYGLQGGGPSLEGGVGGYSEGRNQNLSLNLNRVFSPTLLLDLRYGYSQYRVTVFQPDRNTDLSTKVGIPDINNGDVTNSGLGSIGTSGAGAFSMGGAVTAGAPLYQNMRHHQAAANLTWIKGTHTLKTGGDFRRYMNLRIQPGGSRGSFSFAPGVTGSPVVSNSGFGTASMLTGLVSNYGRQFLLSQDIGNEYEFHAFGYIQDTWKVTPKLTLNYGVRYELYTPPTTPRAAGTNLDLNTFEVLFAGVGDVSSSVNVKADKNNFAPRFGLSYQVTGKTVFRMGGGRSFFPNVFNALISQNYPLIGNQSLNAPGIYTWALNIADKRPAFLFPSVPQSGRMPLPVGVGMTGNPFDRRIGYADSWNIAIQRKLSATTSGEVAYVGNVGRQLYWNLPMNAAIPGPGPLNPRRPLYAKYGFTQGITWRGNSGSMSYHSLQAQFQKRATRDLAFIASYTWSKIMDFGGYDAFNPYDVRNDRGVSDRNRTHMFSLGHTYQLPFGPGKLFLTDASGLVRHLVEGWMFTGVTLAQTGLPVTPRLANSSSLNSDIGLRPDLVGDPTLASPSRALWFNPAAFAVPGLYRMGTAGRNILRGPRFFEANWALSKVFHIDEKRALEFHFETFNTFNNTNLANPTNNVDSPSAGQIFGLIGGANMRQAQLGLRFSF